MKQRIREVQLNTLSNNKEEFLHLGFNVKGFHIDDKENVTLFILEPDNPNVQPVAHQFRLLSLGSEWDNNDGWVDGPMIDMEGLGTPFILIYRVKRAN